MILYNRHNNKCRIKKKKVWQQVASQRELEDQFSEIHEANNKADVTKLKPMCDCLDIKLGITYRDETYQNKYKAWVL